MDFKVSILCEQGHKYFANYRFKYITGNGNSFSFSSILAARDCDTPVIQ